MAIDSVWYLVLGAFVVLGLVMFKFFGKSAVDFKEFKAVLFDDTVTNNLRKKLNLYGKKVKKGKIIIGFETLSHVDKYYETKGEFPVMNYDEDTQNYKDTDEKQEYDFTLFRLKHKFLLFRLLGLKKSYMIIRNRDGEEKELIRFDNKTNRFFFPRGIEFDSYGGIWTESQEAKEYLNNISFLYMLQQTQTHLQNIPNRTVHLEIEQAKKERLAKTYYDLEKAKYEQIKRGDETTVS